MKYQGHKSLHIGLEAARAVWILPLLLIPACGGDDDDDASSTPSDESPTPSDESPTPSDESPTPASPTPAGPTEHCGAITADETWSAVAGVHTVTCDVLLEGATLTIGAGVEVRFALETALYVSKEGGAAGLEVAGTAEAPVVFRGDGGAAWEGVSIQDPGSAALSHLSIRDAVGLPGAAAYTIAPLAIHGAEVSIDTVSIDGGGECGLVLDGGGRLTGSSRGLSVSGAEAWPVCASISSVASLPATGSGYSSDGEDGILVTHRETRLEGPATWEDLGVPYVLADFVTLAGTEGAPAVLTLEAGVVLAFMPEAHLDLSSGSSREPAGLVARGSESAPVRLEGWEREGRGTWGGVRVYPGTVADQFSLTHTVIDGAGGDHVSDAAMRAVGVGPKVDQLTIRRSAQAGIGLEDGAGFQAGSRGLTITDCASVGYVGVAQAASIPEEGAALTGNDADFLVLNDYDLETSAAWGDIGVPYRLVNWLTVQGAGEEAAVLSLEPGVHLEFGPDRYLQVGYSGPGGLRAEGTAERPVVLTAAESLEPGHWRGILLAPGTVEGEAVLRHVEVGYAGGEGFYRRQGSIIVDGAAPVLSELYIHHSECNGIALYGEAAPSMDASSITYLENGCVNLYEEE